VDASEDLTTSDDREAHADRTDHPRDIVVVHRVVSI